MKIIVKKFAIFFCALPLALFLFGLFGTIVCLICHAISAEFLDQFHIRLAAPTSLLLASYVGVFFFGISGFFAGILIGLIGLIFKEPKVMFNQIIKAFGIIILAATVVAIVSMAYVTYLATNGNAPSLSTLFHSTETRSNSFIQAWFLFIGCCAGAVIGLFLSCVHLIRKRFTSQRKKENVHNQSPFGQLTMLLYPPHPLKYLVIFVTIISMSWQLLISKGDFFLASVKTLPGVAMWGVATIYLYDFVAAIRGKNSPFMRKFYSDIARDLYVFGILAISILGLNLLLPIKYNFLNLDIGMLAIGYLIYGLFALKDCAKKRIAGHKLPARASQILLLFIGTTYLLAFYIFYQIQFPGTKITPAESLWLQLTICFTSIYALISTYQLRFFLEEQRIEPSPVLLDLFNSIKSSPGLYLDAAQAAEQWNHHVKLEKTRQRFAKGSTKKKKR